MKTLIAILCFVCHAHADTVKVVSQTAMKRSNGSGWLIQTSRGPLVVASQHTVLPGGTVQVKFENTNVSVAATEVWSDWSKGLSILRLDEAPPAEPDEGVNPDMLKSLTVLKGDEVIVRGFAAHASLEAAEVPGVVSVARSNRPFLPLINGIELVRSHGEYGMSGGPVYRKKDHQFVGILSHQVLKVVPGSDSRIEEMQEYTIASSLFVIPASVVGAALKSYLTDGASAGLFTQLSGKDEPLSIGFQDFELTLRAEKEKPIILAKGGDGAGVGGEENPGSAQVELKLNRLGAVRNVPAHLAVYLDSWRDSLLKNRPVVIRGFVKKSKDGYRRQGFASMEEFVNLLMQTDEIPYGVRGDLSAPGRVQAVANDLKEALRPLEGMKDLNLVQHLHSLVEILTEDFGPSVVTVKDIRDAKDVKGTFKADWSAVFARLPFDNGEDVLRQLSRLQDLL